MPTLQQIAKTEINLQSKEEKQNVGTALMAINKVLADAAEKGEKVSFFQIVKRAYHIKNELDKNLNQPQNTLPNHDSRTK